MTDASADPGFGTDTREVFLAWEKLRLLYLSVLTGWTLILMAGLSHVSDAGVWFEVVVGGVLANICYLTGPLLESYARWLGLRSRWLRWILFIVGTLLTMFFALIILIMHGFPD